MKTLSATLAALALTLMQGCTPLIVAGTVVGAGTAIGVDRRTTGTLVEDQAIEIKATDRIYADEKMGKQVHIRVTSFNKHVLLTGEAPTAEMRDRAVAIVQAVPHVAGIYNEIRIAEPSGLDARSQEKWLGTKVKTQLLVDKGQPTHTKVVVSDGTVYLMGLLDEAEAQHAIDVARRVDGVERVVKLFEYVDSGTRLAEPQPRIPADLRHAATTEPEPQEPEGGAVAIPYIPQSETMFSEQ